MPALPFGKLWALRIGPSPRSVRRLTRHTPAAAPRGHPVRMRQRRKAALSFGPPLVNDGEYGRESLSSKEYTGYF